MLVTSSMSALLCLGWGGLTTPVESTICNSKTVNCQTTQLLEASATLVVSLISTWAITYYKRYWCWDSRIKPFLSKNFNNLITNKKGLTTQDEARLKPPLPFRSFLLDGLILFNFLFLNWFERILPDSHWHDLVLWSLPCHLLWHHCWVGGGCDVQSRGSLPLVLDSSIQLHHLCWSHRWVWWCDQWDGCVCQQQHEDGPESPHLHHGPCPCLFGALRTDV